MKREICMISLMLVVGTIISGCIEERSIADLKSYQIIKSEYNPYSSTSPNDMVYFLEIKNPTLKTVDDEIEQVKYLVEMKMKIDYPNAYEYDIKIGNSYYVYYNKPYENENKGKIKKVK